MSDAPNITPTTPERFFLREEALSALIGDLLAASVEVIAPVAAACASPSEAAGAACLATAPRARYQLLHDASELALGRSLPELSLKQFFLPSQEALCHWRQRGTSTLVQDVPTTFTPRVVLAAKPCDSAGLAVVDRVMNWDYADELWNGRREATTIFNLACPVLDDSCFCTSVGSAPDDTKGADGLLTPVEGGYLVEPTTERGRAFVAAHAERFTPEGHTAESAARAERASEQRATARARVEANLKIDAEEVCTWIDTHFGHPLLTAIAVRCNGCGACTGVCPTCHCFDILDEEEGVGRGTRRRLWDTCQAANFTLHAGGHNPRDNQHVRYRQRINHKFAIYPLKFGEVLCTGCGRCTRVCHAGQDLVEILAAINAAAQRPSEDEATAEVTS